MGKYYFLALLWLLLAGCGGGGCYDADDDATDVITESGADDSSDEGFDEGADDGAGGGSEGDEQDEPPAGGGDLGGEEAGVSDAEKVERVRQVLADSALESPGGGIVTLLCEFPPPDEYRILVSLEGDPDKFDADTVLTRDPSELTSTEAQWFEVRDQLEGEHEPRFASSSPSPGADFDSVLCLYHFGGQPAVSIVLFDSLGRQFPVEVRRSGATFEYQAEDFGVDGEIEILISDAEPPLEVLGVATTARTRSFPIDVSGSSFLYPDGVVPGVYPALQLMVRYQPDDGAHIESFSASGEEGRLEGRLVFVEEEG